MRVTPLCVSLSLLLSSAAFAQDAEPDCVTSWRTLAAWLGIPNSPDHVAAVTDGWCELADLTLGGDAQYSPFVTIDHVRWQTDGAFLFDNGMRLPHGLSLRVEGLRIGVTTGDPLMDYMMAAQRVPAPISGSLEMNWDEATQLLTLTDLGVDFPGDNAFAASMTIADADLATIDTAQAGLLGAKLTQAAVSVQTNGLFEQYLLMPLGNLFLTGAPDPAASMETFRKQAATWIDGVPDVVLSAPDQAALAAFVRDLPNPTGTVSFTLDSEVGFGATRLAPAMLTGIGTAFDDLPALFDGVDIGFTYQPAN